MDDGDFDIVSDYLTKDEIRTVKQQIMSTCNYLDRQRKHKDQAGQNRANTKKAPLQNWVVKLEISIFWSILWVIYLTDNKLICVCNILGSNVNEYDDDNVLWKNLKHEYLNFTKLTDTLQNTLLLPSEHSSFAFRTLFIYLQKTLFLPSEYSSFTLFF